MALSSDASSQGYEHQVKELLPDKKFTLMVVVLKKFYEFLKLTANVSPPYPRHSSCVCVCVFLFFLILVFIFLLQAVTSTRGLKNTQLVIKFMEKSDASDSDSYLK